MSLNETVSAERIHISLFGLRNAGKSSLVNALTGQSLAVVSPVKGTTTDPVKKAMELLPLGPVLLTDTPGLDDSGDLGTQRVEKAKQTLAHTDIALHVVDAAQGLTDLDEAMLAQYRDRDLPYLLVMNKADLLPTLPPDTDDTVYVSAVAGQGIRTLKERLGAFLPRLQREKHLLADLIDPGDTVVLVIPIDASAPKGRLILPQQMVLRELLDFHCSALCCQPEELTGVLKSLREPPRLVVTDSQAFARVAPQVPQHVPLTSFSILFARYKGNLQQQLAGAKALETLRDGDVVLIAEGCTHHRQCGDIGTEKLPAWIRAFSKANPAFRFTSGGEFPTDLSGVRLVVHCGGCMLNEKEMQSRLSRAAAQGVPVVNYGLAIAHMHGLLERAVAPVTE